MNTIEFADNLTGTTGNTIVLQSDLPQVTNDLVVAGSVYLNINGHLGLEAASTHSVTETNYVASGGGTTQSTSTSSHPVYLDLSGFPDAVPGPVAVNTVHITYGTALTNSQLIGTDTQNNTIVPGTFIYTTAAGTVLGAGNNQSEAVTFTPTDTTNFSTATGTVNVDVAKATPSVGVVGVVNITYGTALANGQINGSATFTVGGSHVTVPRPVCLHD